MLFHHYHHHFFGFFGLPFVLISFLPTIIAAVRRSRHVVPIFLVNLFLSWTVIGWFVALIWAITSQPRWDYRYGQPYYPQGPFRRY
jgi:Na+(H+)/acetate symporter ActP